MFKWTHLAVSANEEAALAGVDTVAGERVDFDLLLAPKEREKV